jgi:hypothetical protein
VEGLLELEGLEVHMLCYVMVPLQPYSLASTHPPAP